MALPLTFPLPNQPLLLFNVQQAPAIPAFHPSFGVQIGWNAPDRPLPFLDMHFDLHPGVFRQADPASGRPPSRLREWLRVSRCHVLHPIDCLDCDRVCVHALTGVWTEWERALPADPGQPRPTPMSRILCKLDRYMESMRRGEAPTDEEQYVRLTNRRVTDVTVEAGAHNDSHHLPDAAAAIAASDDEHVAVRRFLLSNKRLPYPLPYAMSASLPRAVYFRFPISHYQALQAIFDSGKAGVLIADLDDHIDGLALCKELWRLALLERAPPPRGRGTRHRGGVGRR